MIKFMKWAGVAAGAVASLGVAALANAQTAVVIPTSTAADIAAGAGAQFADPGTLTVLEFVGGAIFAFWLIHMLLGLIPRARGGGRRS